MTINELLWGSVERFPNEKALTFPGTSVTYRELGAWVEALAVAFGRIGLGSGDAACLLLNNCPDFVASYFAIVRSGAAVVPLNTFLRPEELKTIIDDSRSKLLVTSLAFAPAVDQIRDSLSHIEHVVYVDSSDERYVTFEKKGLSTFCPEGPGEKGAKYLLPGGSEGCCAQKVLSPFFSPFSPDDSRTATIIYTSGTTGRSKGVLLSHGNLTANVESCRDVFTVTQKDRFLLFLPMFHSFTLTANVLLPISAGARIVMCESVKPFRRLLKRIVIEKVTIIAAVPAFYEALCKTKVPGLSLLMRSVRFCISGSAPLSRDTIVSFEEKFSKPLLEGYGLSEASPVVSVNPLDGVRKAGSVGMPIPRVEVKILTEEGQPADTGQAGEITVRGPNIMQGYLRMPEETAQVMRDGWLLTGDIGCLDEDGYLRIVDRKKDLILHRGMNVYPREIEDVLNRNPHIKEAAVVGAPHSSHGEIPAAHVILEDGAKITEQEIKDYCREHLADYKVPRSVRFTNDFPRTAIGKILKRELKRQCGY